MPVWMDVRAMSSISPTAGTKQQLSQSVSPRRDHKPDLQQEASHFKSKDPYFIIFALFCLFLKKMLRYPKCAWLRNMLFTHPFVLQPVVALSNFFFSWLSFFCSLTCMIMPLLLSAAKIFMAIIHQQDSCRENSVCSPALNELTFHEAPVFIDELLRVSESFFRQRWRQAEFTQLNTQTKGFG